MSLRHPLLATLFAALLLLGAKSALEAPTPVQAVTSCTLLFNLFDADATNAGSTTPGGTSAALAYPGYTNGTTVAIDMKPSSATDCAAISRSYWYSMFSLWHEAIFGRTTSWTVATSNAENWGQVDRIPNATMTSSSTVFDWKNDFGPGTATAPAAAFDLGAAGTATPDNGATVTVYGDAAKCDFDQGTTPGFAPAYARRLVDGYPNDTMGVWHWLAKTLTNPYSRYQPVGGSETAGGGGKGTCSTMVARHLADTIIYDNTAPVISSLLTTAGYPGGRTKSLTLDTSKVTESGSALWLMSLTNSSTCTATTGLWSPWEAYATSKVWDITSPTYGGNGTSTDGPRTVCLRVVDRAGNIGFYKGTLSIDTVTPTFVSFTSTAPSPTGLVDIPYTLTFNEPVYLVAPADFSNAGTATGCTFLASPVGAGTSWTITARACGAAGTVSTLTPRLAALSVVDAGGNAAPASAADGTTLTVDRIAPTITTFALQAASDSGVSSSDRLTKATSLVYDLVFSESVSGLAAADFTNTGTATGCTYAPSAASGTTFTVTASGCGNGTLILRLVASAALDSIGNPTPQANAASVSIDRLAPSITYTCSATATSGFAACPAYAKAATYVRVSAVDAGLSSFVADVLAGVTGFGSCTLANSLTGAGADQYRTYLCSAASSYAFAASVTDRAGNGPTAVNGSLMIDLTAPTVAFTCATSLSGTYGTCPTTTNVAQFVRISASDAESSFASNALTASGVSACTLQSSSLAAGGNQSLIYKCASLRSYTITGTVTDRAGNGPIKGTLSFTIA